MKQTYTITGMTCNGCVETVTDALERLEEIAQVNVDLDANQATITFNKKVDLQTLQKALPKKYSITKKETNVFNTVQEPEKSIWKQLYPLFLIFFYLTVSSVLLNIKPWDIQGFMLDFMGLFYIVFSFFKFLDLKGFPPTFSMYDPLAKVLPVYGWIYPFIELALGLMFLMRFNIDIALWVTIVILGLTTIGVTRVLLNKQSIQCACLGTALKLPMTKATFIENTVMLVMAIAMLLS